MHKKHIVSSLLFLLSIPLQSMKESNVLSVIQKRKLIEKDLKKELQEQLQDKETLLKKYYWAIINDEQSHDNYEFHNKMLALYYNNGCRLNDFENILNRPQMFAISTASELETVISNATLLIASYIHHNRASNEFQFHTIHQSLTNPQLTLQDSLDTLHKNTKEGTFEYICELLKSCEKNLKRDAICLVTDKNAIQKLKLESPQSTLPGYNTRAYFFDTDRALAKPYQPYIEFLQNNKHTMYNYLLAHIKFFIDLSNRDVPYMRFLKKYNPTLYDDIMRTVSEKNYKKFEDKIQIFHPSLWSYNK